MHIEEIVNWIERAFGDEPPLGDAAGTEDAQRLLQGQEYQEYLQDLINRQIIRDYLTNAVLLGVISEGGLPAFAPQIASEEGRAALALHMLMSSVEEAPDLPLANGEVQVLEPLQPDSEPLQSKKGDRSHIKLVPN